MNITYDLILDTTQDDCPIPIIKAKDVLDAMLSGQVLKIITSKEGTIGNIRVLVQNNPYELLSESKSEGHYLFHVKKL